MAWDHLSINRPHLAYLILGAFTSLFMLVSLFVKQRLYIGEATVATICGIIFGPHAANLLDPASWGNVDQITLECSRIVLVVQCFAIGVELPRAYMERHWRSVTFLLVPVMAFGWLITSVFIWWMIKPLTWLESLCCAACVTATDPVLASSVVGKGKFAKRVPKHLRDLLSAESGCNDGMAFPFIYLALYLIKYRPHAGEVAFHWICFTVLYECILGAVYGFVVGYLGRHAIKWAEKHDMVDRESFLVFYFVLALFCAGSGSLLGLDDLLVGFAAGVGFSNDGWFQEKTEESHVSNVIDLLLNLAYFVYFGAIIPWAQFNEPSLGITPGRLVVIAVLVILFRRIPIMVALKPIIPDIKTWREALFAGHFGPIGVGAIFVAILARAELETDGTTPLAELPGPGSKHYTLIQVIWPITTFLVISSILVHGSSIAVFTLGKRINTLTITMSYTQANEDGPSWMNRLPRIATQPRSSMSFRKPDPDSESSNEKLPEYPPGTLPPIGLPGNFLRRQKEEENPSRQGSRSSSVRPPTKSSKRDFEIGPGGPISQSAISPQKREDETIESPAEAGDVQETVADRSSESKEPELGMYEEGNEMIVEDREGNVIGQEHLSNRSSAQEKGQHALGKIKESVEHPTRPLQHFKQRMSSWNWARSGKSEATTPKPAGPKRGPAHAYQFGNTIIVEDEDGEVVKKYTIPGPKKDNPEPQDEAGPSSSSRPQALQRMSTWIGRGRKDLEARQKVTKVDEDHNIRFVSGGRRMSKADFIQQIQRLDPKAGAQLVAQSDAPPEVKQEARAQIQGALGIESDEEEGGAYLKKEPEGGGETSRTPEGLTLVDSHEQEIPVHAVGDDIARYSRGTAAQRRRERAMRVEEEDSDDDGTERVPPRRLRSQQETPATDTEGPSIQRETAAERRRREAALGMGGSEASDSDDDDDEPRVHRAAVQEPTRIRFADPPPTRRPRS
ncbi:MAG: hypothetical protein M1816_000980 [Peltula sp. TS41687]|nr:MAG: hypothetical protein M1816_000980 [Peltula sp. TS41687]